MPIVYVIALFSAVLAVLIVSPRFISYEGIPLVRSVREWGFAPNNTYVVTRQSKDDRHDQPLAL